METHREHPKIEDIDKETILIVSEYVDLYFDHTAKAHKFYMEHQEVIDGVFELYEGRGQKKYWEREQILKNWMELKNQ